MRSLSRLATNCLFIAAAGLGLSACDPGYTYYSVHITSAAGTSAKTNPPTRGTAREYIENCYITICTSEPCKSGDGMKNKVLEKKLLGPAIAGAPGSTANQSGCSGGLTPYNVGYFHYSSSRASKDLIFTVEAFDSGSNTGDDGQVQLIQAVTKTPPYDGSPELQIEAGMQPVNP